MKRCPPSSGEWTNRWGGRAARYCRPPREAALLLGSDCLNYTHGDTQGLTIPPHNMPMANMQALRHCHLGDDRSSNGRSLLDRVKHSVRHSFAVVGLVERFNETLTLLEALLTGTTGADSFFRDQAERSGAYNRNSADKATKDAALAEMPTCIDRLRREHLSADIEIYDTAVKVFEAQVAALAAARHAEKNPLPFR